MTIRLGCQLEFAPTLPSQENKSCAALFDSCHAEHMQEQTLIPEPPQELLAMGGSAASYQL